MFELMFIFEFVFKFSDLFKTVYITEADNYSEICTDFINGLINKNPSKRIGAGSGISGCDGW